MLKNPLPHNIIWRWLLFGLVGLLIFSHAHAETSLWRISKGSAALLIGGTVHMLTEADYPLPDEFEQAFRESQLLVLETDIEVLAKPGLEAKIKEQLIYNDGSHLEDHLKPSTYRALRRYCRSAKLPISSMQAMKPALVVLTLTLLKMKADGMEAGSGVDEFYSQKAKAAKKPVAGLESLETQITALASMGAGQEDEFLLSTLKDLKKTDQTIENITGAWRKGNLAQLEKLGIIPMQGESPELSANLLANRNAAWLPKIEGMLRTQEKELILVGALHLAGKDGILAQLQKKGYRIEQY